MARHVWPGLDGLRGIAVLAVVLFHASLGWSANGYVGVDVFFALSGFLITWLLISERVRNGTIALRAFYMRRILRLYPALVATVTMVVALALAVGRLGDVLPGALAALFYGANWWIYTGHDALLLEHTWTLAIEEHFYLGWPMLVVLLMAPKRALRLVGLVAMLSVAGVMVAPWPDSIEAVKGSYLRGVPILWGSVLAALIHRWDPGPRVKRILGPTTGLAALALTALVLIPRPLPQEWLTGPRSVPGMLSVLVVAGVVIAPTSLGALALTWRPLRWAGRRAYGIYLYHLPVISVLVHQVDAGLPWWIRAGAGVGVSILLAAASYRWLETPFLKLKSRFDSRESHGRNQVEPGLGVLGTPLSRATRHGRKHSCDQGASHQDISPARSD